MNNKEIAAAIVKALENKDTVALYGIALELLKDETNTYEKGYEQGVTDTLSELQEVYGDSIEETDLWNEHMTGDNN